MSSGSGFGGEVTRQAGGRAGRPGGLVEGQGLTDRDLAADDLLDAAGPVVVEPFEAQGVAAVIPRRLPRHQAIQYITSLSHAAID